MTTKGVTGVVLIKKSSTHISWSDDVEFLRFEYASVTYDNGVLCIRPCEKPSRGSRGCKKVSHFGRKFYLSISPKVPDGYYMLTNVDTNPVTICFKKVEGYGEG